MITLLFHRKRLLFWLIRAYLRKRRQTILSFFVAGILLAALVYLARPLLEPLIPKKALSIGIIGPPATIETLPLDVQNQISMGLTRLTQDGSASSSASLYFEPSTDGRSYTFVLRNDLFWQDGKKFTAADINYNFRDVTIEVKSDTEILFLLKEPFAPFPLVVSQPLFREGLIGLSGDYKVVAIELNGSFISELTLEASRREIKPQRILYKFYTSEEEARMRFMLGEVETLTNIVDPGDFVNWKNVEMRKRVAENQLVTLFYNTSFPLLSDKAVRQALTFALPNDFAQEAKATSPINRNSWAYVAQDKFSHNIGTAKKLLEDLRQATQSGNIVLTLTTTTQFSDLAQRIQDNWSEIGVDLTIEIVEKLPSDPQILLERFRIPTDPDQYSLWHSTQATNISHFANPKIDKLLEDGRQIVNREERAQIYADFQKHLIEETPAAFLYYPTVYTITRK